MAAHERTPSPHAVQAAGRHLVAGEALLRGLSAEIHVSGRLGWVSINGRRVEVHAAKDEWPLTGPRVQPDADAVVFVRRGERGAHEYFIATRDQAIAALDADMAAQMRKWDGQRPRTPGSDQQTLHRHIAEPWRDRWDVLADR